MLFFLIISVWILCVLSGIVLLCFQKLRRIGLYTISVSTAATLVSFFLSTSIIYFGSGISTQWMGRWAGVVLLGAYFLAIGIGALIGALAGFLLTRKLLPRVD
jgi:hypothetical protein